MILTGYAALKLGFFLDWTILEHIVESLLAVFIEHLMNHSFCCWASKNSEVEVWASALLGLK